MGSSNFCSKAAGGTGLLVNLLASAYDVNLPGGSPVKLDLGAAVKQELRLLCQDSPTKEPVFSLTGKMSSAASAALISSLSDYATAKSVEPAGGFPGTAAVSPSYNPRLTWLDVDFAAVVWYEKSDQPGIGKINAFGFRPTAVGLSIQKSFGP